jgi:hypothetical protein
MMNIDNAGFTELSAIDKIHQAYGVHLSVSAILSKMQKDLEKWRSSQLIPLLNYRNVLRDIDFKT